MAIQLQLWDQRRMFECEGKHFSMNSTGETLLLRACIVKAKYLYSKTKQWLRELRDSQQFSKKKKNK